MSESGGFKEIMPTIFLAVVVCIAVTLLVLTNEVTWEKIEENEKKEIQEGLEEIFPDMINYTEDEKLDIYIINGDGKETGIAFIVEGNGYGGVIKMLVGLDVTRSELKNMRADEVPIKGMKIVPPISETPGLGAKIEEESFQAQFEGMTMGDVELDKNGGQVDAISGATISSDAVVSAIRKIATEKIEKIKEEVS